MSLTAPLWSLLLLLSAVAAEKHGKIIKGQQHVKHNTIARIEGGPVSAELIAVLQGNATFDGSSFDKNATQNPLLITNDVSTRVIRMVIPLSVAYTSNPEYLAMVRKFLSKNRINLREIDPLEGHTLPDVQELLDFLVVSARLRRNILEAFGRLRYLYADQLPTGVHPALSQIYVLLELNRIRAVDLFEAIPKLLATNSLQAQWTILMQELGQIIPVYMRSCTSFIVEKLEDQTLRIKDILENADQISFVQHIHWRNPDTKAASITIAFPKAILDTIPEVHQQEVGRTLAAMLTAVPHLQKQLHHKFLAAILLQLPRNTPSSLLDQAAFEIIKSDMEVPVSEQKLIADAMFKELSTNQPSIHNALVKVLVKITKTETQFKEQWQTIVSEMQKSTETYVLPQFESAVHALKPNKYYLETLFSSAMILGTSQVLIEAKSEILKIVEANPVVMPDSSKYHAGSPIQQLQLFLRLLKKQMSTVPNAITTVEVYLYLCNVWLNKGHFSLVEETILYMGYTDGASKRQAGAIIGIGNSLLGKCPVSPGTEIDEENKCTSEVLQRNIGDELYMSPLCNDLAKSLFQMVKCSQGGCNRK